MVGEIVNVVLYLGGIGFKGLVNVVFWNFEWDGLVDKVIDNFIIESGFLKWLYKVIDNVYFDDVDVVWEVINVMVLIWLWVN